MLDTWGTRFYEELNFVAEAENGLRFRRSMVALSEVTAPKPIFEYTSRRILTLEWIDGTRLTDAPPDEVLRLTRVGINCYFMQMMETGFFHADPHPGNLMRTSDGKLCVLDFGLMSEITEKQQYGLIENIAYIVRRNYPEVVRTYVDMGFIPEDTKGTDLSQYSDVVARVFDIALSDVSTEIKQIGV